MAAGSGRSDDSVVISVGPMVSSLKVELKNAPLSMPQSNCIFKTPSILFRHKEKSFFPVAFPLVQCTMAKKIWHDYAAELGNEFVKTMVLDAVFIIELFRQEAGEITKEKDDPIFSMACMLQFLHHDLILMKNQIPWLVLEILFDKTKLLFETKSLIELALGFFA
ncbi:hypothetical protein DITRI_Ditri09bG0011500 [Diplodiscus trichospermus]